MFDKIFVIVYATLALSATNITIMTPILTSVGISTLLEPNLTSRVYTTVLHPNLTSTIRTTVLQPNLTSVFSTTALQPKSTNIASSSVLEPNSTSIVSTFSLQPNSTKVVSTSALQPNSTSIEPATTLRSNLTSIILTTLLQPNLTSTIVTTVSKPNLTSIILTTALQPNVTSVLSTTISNQNITSIIFTTVLYPNRTSITSTSSIKPSYVTSSKVTYGVSSSVTPSITPTTVPSPTPTTGPPKVHYQFPENNSCIELESEIGIKIPNISQIVWLDQSASINGSCGFSSSFITFYYLSPLEIILTMNFYANASTWSLTNITVSLVNTSSKLWSVQEEPISKVPLNSSYHCDDGREFNLVSGNSKVTIIFTQLIIQSNINNGLYDKHKTFCANSVSPKESSSIVPIAVGGALAGLIVIVLIGYLVGRRRSGRGYQKL